VVEDAGRGYRRVVASPRPLEIVEWDVIRDLVSAGAVVIAVGGGGIPVIRKPDGDLDGVEAVIDKDLATSLLARQLEAEGMVIVTNVERVAVGFGTPGQKDLDHLTVEEARQYLEAGEFPAGSMGPKIRGAVEFIEAGGAWAAITSPDRVREAIEGRGGTRIERSTVSTRKGEAS
jgi:carbamate kinase